MSNILPFFSTWPNNTSSNEISKLLKFFYMKFCWNYVYLLLKIYLFNLNKLNIKGLYIFYFSFLIFQIFTLVFYQTRIKLHLKITILDLWVPQLKLPTQKLNWNQDWICWNPLRRNSSLSKMFFIQSIMVKILK